MSDTLESNRRLISDQIWHLPRLDQPELLDLGAGTPQDVAANLAEMWRINRVLGGFHALTRHLYPRLAAAEGPLTVVDLGTGSADIPAAIARWAQARQLKITVLGVDWAARNLAVASQRTQRTQDLHLVRADAARLPLKSDTADYILSSLFLHHFNPDDVVGLLHTSYAAARRGIIMSDLVRGRIPLTAFRLIQPVFARNYLTRHDGALSVRRAYTPEEMRALADAAGLPHAQITSHWPWRVTLVADK